MNVILHKSNDKPLRVGDIVQTLQGPCFVQNYSYGHHGARIAVDGYERLIMASECGCYVTSRD